MAHTPIHATEEDPPAKRMLGKIQASLRIQRQVMRWREKYAKVLSINYHDSDDRQDASSAMDGENFTRHGENFSWVLMRFIMAQVAGEPLYIKGDRGAGPGQTTPNSPGDAKSGAWVDEVLRRAAYEGELETEMEALARAISAYGCGAMVVGYRDGSSRRDALIEASKDHEAVMAEVLEGDTEAKRGQDHERIQFHLRELTQKESLGPEEAKLLVARARSHDKMREKEEEEHRLSKKQDAPAWVFDWRLSEQDVWARYRHVSLDVTFDMTVNDVRHTSWRAERVLVPLAEFKRNPDYSQAARTAAEGMATRQKSMLADDDQPQSQIGEIYKETGHEKMVETWHVWIIRPGMRSGGIRRIVSPEPALQDMWIHANEDYPYVRKQVIKQQDGSSVTGPDHGKSYIRGWWPIDICAPLRGPVPVPETMLGIPLVAPPWAQQVNINQLSAIDHAKAKRALRMWLGDKSALADEKDRKAIENAAAAGIDGTFHWVTPASGHKVDDVVASLDMRNAVPEITEQRLLERRTWAQVARFPAGLMELQSADKTLGQAEMAEDQASAEMAMILKSFEKTASWVVKGWTGMIRQFYSHPKLRRMLGQAGALVVMEWKEAALDGDRVETRLGLRAMQQKLVDREQLMKAIELINTQFVDDIGAPIYDMRPAAEELLRSMKMGTLEPLKTDETDPRYAKVLQTLDAMAVFIKEIAKKVGMGDDNKAGSEGATPGPDKEFSPHVQAPQSGTMNTAVRRNMASA